MIDGTLDPERRAMMLRANPLRRLVQRLCRSCGYFWQAPTDKGACPRCHETENVETLSETTCCAQRV